MDKAKGGIGMTMTAGSAAVAEDSPPAFGNLHGTHSALSAAELLVKDL